MKTRLWIIAVLAVVLLLAFSGCAGEPEPLRVCVDLPMTIGTASPPETVAGSFFTDLEEFAVLDGLDLDIKVELIPREGVERETAIDRIRTEIMGGEGPDVFIISNAMFFSSGSNALFTMPEKAMANGIFLPLDAYMENHTRYTQWDKQIPQIMEAGRDRYGQQIIPLSYTFPVTCFLQSEAAHNPSVHLTWNDMLEDESGIMSIAGTMFHMESTVLSAWNDNYLENVLGQLADYNTDTLAFTEEELKSRIIELIELQEQEKAGKYADVPVHYQVCLHDNYDYSASEVLYPDGKDPFMGIRQEDAQTMIPIYSDDGGTGATIISYAAINANTRQPENAFYVIDFLMSTKNQQRSSFYTALMRECGLPMHQDILQSELCMKSYFAFSEVNFEEFCRVRDTITHVYFKGIFLEELDILYQKCSSLYAQGEDISPVVSEYYQKMERILGE